MGWFRKKPKELPEEVLRAIEVILKENQNRAAFNAGVSREVFAEAVYKGEVEYSGMTAEEVAVELKKRGYDW